MKMTKVVLALLFPLLLCAKEYAKKVGFEFFAGASSEVGVKIHCNSVYAINPGVTFQLGSYNTSESEYDDYTDIVVGVTIDNHFYLPEIKELDHYILLDFSMRSVIDPYIPDMGTGYGLQYAFNDNIAVFGEMAFTISFETDQMGIGKSGVGLIFYVR